MHSNCSNDKNIETSFLGLIYQEPNGLKSYGRYRTQSGTQETTLDINYCCNNNTPILQPCELTHRLNNMFKIRQIPIAESGLNSVFNHSPHYCHFCSEVREINLASPPPPKKKIRLHVEKSMPIKEVKQEVLHSLDQEGEEYVSQMSRLKGQTNHRLLTYRWSERGSDTGRLNLGIRSVNYT